TDDDENPTCHERCYTAQRLESHPTRYWDHYIGPRDRRLYRIPSPGAGTVEFPDGARAEPELVIDGTGQHLDEAAFDVTPDGSTVLTVWNPRRGVLDLASDLVAVDVAPGDRRTLVAADHVARAAV